jgi:hypothetical protein
MSTLATSPSLLARTLATSAPAESEAPQAPPKPAKRLPAESDDGWSLPRGNALSPEQRAALFSDGVNAGPNRLTALFSKTTRERRAAERAKKTRTPR